MDEETAGGLDGVEVGFQVYFQGFTVFGVVPDVVGFQGKQFLGTDHVGRQFSGAAFHQIIEGDVLEPMYPSVVLVFTSDVEGDLGLLIAIEQIHGSLDWVANACFQEAVAEEEDGVVQQLVDRTVVAGQVDEDDQVIFIAECAGAGNNFFKMVAEYLLVRFCWSREAIFRFIQQ